MVLESKIDRFIGNISLGVNFFHTAATQLVAMIDEEPDVCHRIVEMKRVDWLTMDVLETFQAIGRKQLSIEAMFLPKHVIGRMLALPVETQAEIALNPVKVLRGGGRRITDQSVLKSASKLTKREAVVSIGPSGVRSIEEQKSVVESMSVEPTEKTTVVSRDLFNDLLATVRAISLDEEDPSELCRRVLEKHNLQCR